MLGFQPQATAAIILSPIEVIQRCATDRPDRPATALIRQRREARAWASGRHFGVVHVDQPAIAAGTAGRVLASTIADAAYYIPLRYCLGFPEGGRLRCYRLKICTCAGVCIVPQLSGRCARTNRRAQFADSAFRGPRHQRCELHSGGRRDCGDDAATGESSVSSA